MSEKTFTPALGRLLPSRFFDLVGILVREQVWRGLVVREAALRPGELAVDVGCGTGTLALLLQRTETGARVIGVDPDPEILTRARTKAGREVGSGVPPVEWRTGLGEK